MLPANDKENLTKACQTANLLTQDLRSLIKTDNPFLGELLMETLAEAVRLEQRLLRLQTLASDED